MRKIFLLLSLVVLSFFVNAQVTTNGGSGLASSYGSLDAAINALNAATITAPVVITLTASTPETAPAGGYVITAQGTVTNTITINGSSNTITASSSQNAGGRNNAIFKIIGGDYITLQGFVMQENPANVIATLASNTMTEWGVALLYSTTTNGAQNNTIQNNTISLNRTNLNTFGIYSNTRHSANTVTTTADVTSATGSNSNNKVYNNAISNVNYGIVFIGAGTVAYMDNGNDIGGTAIGTGSTLTNCGGGGHSGGYIGVTGFNYMIVLTNQIGSNISYNSITTATLTNSLNTGGILQNFSNSPTTGTFTNTITNNTITITNNPTAANGGNIIGITNQGLTPLLPTATISINNNTIQNCVLGGTTSTANSVNAIINSSVPGTLNINGNTVLNNASTATSAISGAIVAIQNSAAAGTVNINNNIIRGLASTAASMEIRGISNNGAVVTALNINNNQLGNATSGFFSTSIATSGTLYGIVTTGGAATCALSIQSNDIRGIAYNVAASVAQNYIYNEVATLSQNISYNTFTNLNVNTTGSVVFISNDVGLPAGGSLTASSNSIVTAFNKAGAGGTVTLYLTTAFTISVTSTTKTEQNNNFSNITLTGATIMNGWMDIEGVGTGLTKIISNNTFSNWTCGSGAVNVLQVGYCKGSSTVNSNTISSIAGSAAITGINLLSNNVVLAVNSNAINSLSSTGSAGAVTAISNAIPTGNIYSNTINTLSTNGAFTVTGIASSGTTTSNIYKNKVYDLSGANASSTVRGIEISAGTTANVYNNLIGDLRAPIASITSPGSAIIGINLTSTATSSNLNVYYNTVYINATSTGTNFATTGIFHTINTTSTRARLDLRNNIIVNTSTATGTGLTVAYRRSGGAASNLANYASTSNNNLFYAGTPSGINLIYYDGISSAQTIETYKFGVYTAGTILPRDAASISEAPNFMSTVGNDVNFLHMNGSIATAINGSAAAIAGYTDDYDGDTRDASTPDIGADEFLVFLSSNADLSTLSISDGTLSPTFDAATTAYTASVSNVVTSITVNPTTADATANVFVQVNNAGYVSTATALALNVGSNTIDVMVTAQDGTTIKTYTITVTRLNPPGNALNFDGTNDYVDLASNITNLATANFTLEAWVKTTGTGQGIIECSNSNAVWEDGEKSFYIGLDGKPTFVGYNNDYIISTQIVNDGNWHHVAVVWVYSGSGTAGTGKMYIDGLDKTSPSTNYAARSGNAGTFKIGSPNYYSGETPNFFNGSIDEVRIWNVARTATEIQTNMSNELLGTETGLKAYYKLNQAIAAGTNTGWTIAFDASPNNYNGTLTTFALANATSNWVTGTVPSVTVLTNTDLSALTTTAGTLSPSFAAATTAYTASVSNATTSVTVTPTKSDANANVQVRVNAGTYTTLASGTASSALSLNVGSNNIDVLVTAQDGTTIKTYTITVTRLNPPGNALHFNGSNNYIAVNQSAALKNLGAGNNKFTVEAWVKLDNLTAYHSIFRKTGDYNLYIQPGGFPAIEVWTAGETTSNNDYVYKRASGSLTTGVWTHVAATWDGATGTCIFYINGVVSSVAASSNSNVAGDETLNIGRSTTYLQYFSGALDDARIWNIARSAVEVQANMSNELVGNESNLVAYYRFNQAIAAGTNTGWSLGFDATSNNHYGTLNNFALAGGTSNWITGTVPSATASTNADLSALTTTAGTIAPSFAAATTAYTASVSNATTSVTVTPTKSDANANVQVRVNAGSYTTIPSGTASSSLSLNVGTNIIDVKITAQDGTTIKTYTVTVTRVANTLDNLGLTSSNVSPAAYSLRLLSSTYTGFAIKVRRSSDNATQDIGFVAGNLDTASLKTFVGAGNGFVTTWYDQSGYGRNATQATLATQPAIVSAGTIIRKNTVPAIYFNTQTLATTAFSGAYSAGFTLAICGGVNSNTTFSTFGAKTFNNNPSPFDSYNALSLTGNGSGGAASVGNLTNGITAASGFSQWVFSADASTMANFRNGIANGSVAFSGYRDTDNTALILGSRADAVTSLNGWISEFVSFGSKLSTTDRQTTETAQKAYYFSANADLSALTTTAGSITPSFATATIAYTASVTNATTNVTVTPTKADATATVQVRVNSGSYATATNGAASSALSLNVGSNTIDVKVTAQDGTTIKTYTITVTRACLPSSSSTSIINCGDYTWNGQTYTTSGTYTKTFTGGNAQGCDSVATLILTVYALPTVTQPSNQTVCKDAATSAINFSGTAGANNYTWTNNNTAIGLAASGTGHIASFTATNNTSSPITATVTVTPSSIPFAYITNANENTVSVVNTVTNAVTATIPVGTYPFGVAVSPDRTKVYVSNVNSNNVSVINTATNTVTTTIPVGTVPFGIAFSPDGTTAYIANYTSNNVSVINTATNAVTTTITVGTHPVGLCINADGSKVYVANSGTNNVSVINTVTNTVAATVGVGSYPYGIITSPDGASVYVVNNISNNVSVINTSANTVSATIGVGNSPNGVTVSADGSKLYVSNINTNDVSVISTATNTVSATIAVGNRPNGLSLSPDGSKLYVANLGSANVSIVNTSSNTVASTITVGNGPIAFGNFILGTGCTGTPVTFDITVNAPTASTTNLSICSCNLPYTWNGSTFNAAGSQTAHLINSNGCDSAATLNLSTTAPTSFTWTGNVNTDWSNAGNWNYNAVPTAADTATIAHVVIQPVVTAAASISSITINTGATVTANNTLNITGALTNNGSVTGSGTVALNGSTAQTIAGIGTIANLALNNSTGATISSGNVSITGTLTLTSGTLTTGGLLTLKSNATNTASVAPVTGGINGNVTVERYIPAKLARKWSFVTAPVIGTTLRNAWQQQVFVTGAGTGGAAPCAGTTTGNGIAGTDRYNTNGFDITTNSSPSMYSYNGSLGTGLRWIQQPNTSTTMVAGKGYRLNVRGERGASDANCTAQINTAIPGGPTAATLAATGILSIGDVPVTLDGVSGDYTLLGNPYASSIDFDLFNANNTSLAGKYWFYSPDNAASPTTIYSAYTTGSMTNKPTGYTNGNSNNIASGQSFFVQKAASATVTFMEAHKVAAQSGSFRTISYDWSNAILAGLKNADGSIHIDEVLVRFGNVAGASKNYTDDWDARSINEGSPVIVSLKGTERLAIQTRPLNFFDDTVKLGVTINTIGNYQLSFSEYEAFIAAQTIQLKDKFLNVEQDIKANAVYPFSVTADASSKGDNRFEIVFKSNGALPVSYIGLTAKNKGTNDVEVNWQLPSETDVKKYEVERSANSRDFDIRGTVNSKGNSLVPQNYSFTDAPRLSGISYYRIKATDKSGMINYSPVVKVSNGKEQLSVAIYPNPVKEKLNMVLQNIDGAYTIKISTMDGKTMLIQNGSTVAGNIVTINTASLAAGVYMVETVDSKGNRSIEKMVKE